VSTSNKNIFLTSLYEHNFNIPKNSFSNKVLNDLTLTGKNKVSPPCVLPVSTDRYYNAGIQPGNLRDIKKVSSLGDEYSVIDYFSLRDFVVRDKRAPKV
jgi:hypothetical protein